MNQKSRLDWKLSAPIVLLIAAACGGGGGGSVPGSTVSTGPFRAVRSEPASGSRIFLNESFKVDFTSQIDPATMDLSAITFTAFDLQGNAVSEQPSGTFSVGIAADDTVEGRRLIFSPHFPTDDEYKNGGFKPGRKYLVNLLGGDGRNGTVLKDTRGKNLESSVTFEFTTADGTTPVELFRDTKAGGPRRTSFSVTPIVADKVGLSLQGQVPVEIKLGFDQPLNPSSINLPVKFDTNPINRAVARRGRIYLEYDDPDPLKGKNTWIPTSFELSSNSLAGSLVTLRPLGVLPNNANVRVIVTSEVEDMAGESNLADGTYNKVFASFDTYGGYEPQFDAIVESFDTAARVDQDAPFVDPRAEVNNGFLRANFDFEGSDTTLDYEPTAREVFLNTDYTQIVPKGSPPINVSGGVFQFRNVKIPAGVIVRGTGTRPMVWLVTGDFTVEGELTVSGGDGGRVDTLNSANFPTPGGVGACGGGNGGRGSVNAAGPTYPETEAGYGAGQVKGAGGKGGRMSCLSACGSRGSGGGGGSYATQGDPNFKVQKPATPVTSFVQVQGQGGYGCTGSSGAGTRTLAGGLPGAVPFLDKRTDNNFWGSAINLQRQLRIAGELAGPLGGQGGGGGGDNSSTNTCSTNNPSWINDNKGGGGGGGGGVVIVKALGSIIIKQSGIIHADGGHGGGGEQAGSNNQGAGGGGGSGGMVVLMAGRKIQIDVHGGTYTSNDFNFAVSADGGVSKQGPFVSTEIVGKYNVLHAAGTWDATPTGGFGGMGIVQLMAPAGDNSTDGTGTVLDDNIEFYKNGNTLVTGAEKKSFLAWKGFPNESGTFVDDSNTPTAIGNTDGGDIRPYPTLLPAPYGAKSRARSLWLDTGASVRRELAAGDSLPRGVVPQTQGSTTFGGGPVFSFGGTFKTADAKRGYVAYDSIGASASLTFPTLVDATEIASVDAGASFQGVSAYKITLRQPALGTVANRWSQYRCELLDGTTTRVAEYRVLAHDASTLWLAPDNVLLPEAAKLQKARIINKSFDLITNKSPGFGGTLPVNGAQVPMSNVQIGFAFHKDPSQALNNGTDPLRYPQKVGTFVYDLSDPAVQTATRDKTFVQWEMLFNTLFAETMGSLPPRALSPSLPRPEMHTLVIPYRF